MASHTRSKASNCAESKGCPFWIDHEEGQSLRPIRVMVGEQVDSIDGFRIRPHYFALDLGSCGFDSQYDYVVAQLFQISPKHSRSQEFRWDTMFEMNQRFPFWPDASTSAGESFCYRCSVHSDTRVLKWSDWPQIKHDAIEGDYSRWHFITGVLALCHGKCGKQYRLIARAEWNIDWIR